MVKKAPARARAGFIRVRLIKPGGSEVTRVVKPPKEGRVLTLDKGASYLLDQKRFTLSAGLPTITFVSGKAEAVDPYGQESAITSEELDEVARNAFVSDVKKGLTTGFKESVPYLILGAIALLAMVMVWLFSSIGNDLEAILEAVRSQGYGGGAGAGAGAGPSPNAGG